MGTELTKEGLARLWDTIELYVSKQIASSSDTDSVPLKYILKADFDALEESEKQNVLYIVDNGETAQTTRAKARASSINVLDTLPMGTIIVSVDPDPPSDAWISLDTAALNFGSEAYNPFGMWLTEKYPDSYGMPWGADDPDRGIARMPLMTGNVATHGDIGAETDGVALATEALTNPYDQVKLVTFRWYMHVKEPIPLEVSGGSSGGSGDSGTTVSRYELYFNGQRIYLMGNVGGAAVEYIAGDGIGITDNVISVTNPIVPINQSDYDALGEEEKQNKIFLIDDSSDEDVQWGQESVMTYFVDVQQSGGENRRWTVRKHADGYAEMLCSFETLLTAGASLQGVAMMQLKPGRLPIPLASPPVASLSVVHLLPSSSYYPSSNFTITAHNISEASNMEDGKYVQCPSFDLTPIGTSFPGSTTDIQPMKVSLCVVGFWK